SALTPSPSLGSPHSLHPLALTLRTWPLPSSETTQSGPWPPLVIIWVSCRHSHPPHPPPYSRLTPTAYLLVSHTVFTRTLFDWQLESGVWYHGIISRTRHPPLLHTDLVRPLALTSC